LTDPNIRRRKLYKDAYNSIKAATSLDGVSLVGEAYDIPPFAKMYELVLEEAKKLADDNRYRELKGELDLLIYITRPRASRVQESETITEDFSCLDSRSLSCMNSKQLVVLFYLVRDQILCLINLGKL